MARCPWQATWMVAVLLIASAAELSAQVPPTVERREPALGTVRDDSSTPLPLAAPILPAAAGPPRPSSTDRNVLRMPPRDSSPPGITTPAVPPTQPVAAQPVAAQPVSAQPGSPSPAASSPPATEPPAAVTLTKEAVLRHLEQVQADKELEESVRGDLVKRLQAAAEMLTEADKDAARTAQFQAEIQQAPRLAEEAAAKLAVPAPDVSAEPPAEMSLPQLDQRLAELQTQWEKAKDDHGKRDQEVKRRQERKAELTKQVGEWTQQAEELRAASAAQPPAGKRPVEVLAKTMERDAKAIWLARKIELARTESHRLDAVAKLLPLQRDLAKRQMATLEKEVTLWQRRQADRRRDESLRVAEEARRQLQNAHPALRELVEGNAQLAEKQESLAGSIDHVTEEITLLRKQAEKLEEDFQRLSKRINLARMTRANGVLLRKQRADLAALNQPHNRLRFIETEVPTIQLNKIELEEQRAALGDAETLVSQVDSRLPTDITPGKRQMVQRMAAESFTMRRDLLDRMIAEHDEYSEKLTDLEFACRQVIAKTDEFLAFIDQNILWIRSAEPLEVQDFEIAAAGVAELCHTRLWILLGERAWEGIRRRPLQGGGLLLLVLGLIVMRRRMWNRLQNLCVVDSSNSALHFWPTLEALLLLIVASSVWPSLMWCIGWWLEAPQDSTELTRAIATGLQRGSLFLLLFQLVRYSVQSEGLGETHFGWYPSGTRVVRDNLRWLGILGIPLALVVSVVGELEDGHWNDSLGRLAFIAGMIATATAMHQVFRLQKGMFHEALARAPQSWLNRIRLVSHLTGTGVPCALAVLAAAGYYYSARHLAIRLELTFLIALGLGLAHGVASRWFLVKRRNLAIKQARERRQTQGDSPGDGKAAPAGAPPNLSRIQGQLQILLRYTVGLSVLAIAWYVWSDVFPAFHILDQFHLWGPTESPTTLTSVLVAVLLAIGTVVTSRNLPALLEITVLERLPIDHGGRHAAAIIFRYLIFLAGLLVTARAVQIDWSSIQWLAAAMTVGLGFGLQEIFGNLVSGIIILFERPIRVGDLVTVNGVTGTVTRMQIRATTITDFDRRELIVPNKKFITEDVINWTLTDSVSRITVDVGVAYGSDVNLAQSILKRVAAEHPLVMTEPAPNAILKRFGDSTLDFSLYVFIPSRDVYPIVIHELHAAIEREFRQANIEIAYPQRDVNIRSINSALLPAIGDITRGRAA